MVVKNQLSKEQILELLREYGDSQSNNDTKLSVLEKNLRFLKENGTKENSEERYNLTKELGGSYKIIMTEPIEELRMKYQKKKMIEFLLKFGYKESYLRKKKYDSILKLRNDPKLYEKYGRRELGNVICDNYGISRATVKNWNFEQTRDFFKRDLAKNYNVLNRRKNDIQNYLRDLTSTLFCDLIGDNS
jgi:hypothetical protein